MLHTSLLLPTLLPSQTSFSAHNTWQPFNNATTFLTSLSSLNSLQPPSKKIIFFPSLLQHSPAQVPSYHTPATVLFPHTSFLPMFSWTFFKFLHTAFPPVHHTSDACSKQGLASNSHISQPLSISISPYTLFISQFLPPFLNFSSHPSIKPYSKILYSTFTILSSLIFLSPPLPFPPTIIVLFFLLLNQNLHFIAYFPTSSNITCNSTWSPTIFTIVMKLRIYVLNDSQNWRKVVELYREVAMNSTYSLHMKDWTNWYPTM